MKRAFRWAGFSVLSLSAVGVLAALFVWLAFPRVRPAPQLRVEKSAGKLARGTYLAEHVTVCVDCHSDRDFSRFSGPVVRGTVGRGGERFGHDMGLPGTLVAPNITPAALSDWSDGELFRALTEGVTPDGRAIFPFMAWPAYRNLCRDDIESIIAYLRQLEPIEHQPQKSALDFPVSLIARTIPESFEVPKVCPDRKDTANYGRYLASVAGCADCHTPHEGPDPVLSLSFSGNVAFPMPGGRVVRSANITPDEESGIGRWKREQFVARFARFRDPKNVPAVDQGGFNTPMPWTLYAGMTDEDLGAIYDYLRTVKPVKTEPSARFATR